MKRLIITATVLLTSSAAIAAQPGPQGPYDKIEQILTNVQKALNDIDKKFAGDKIDVSATNATNIFSAEGFAIGNVTQEIKSTSEQIAKNTGYVDINNYRKITLATTNAANSLEAATVKKINQSANTYQESLNDFTLRGTGQNIGYEIQSLELEAANISNTITANTLSEINTQTANVVQRATNRLVGSNLSTSAPSYLPVVNLDAVSAANIAEVTASTNLTQTGSVNQLSHNIFHATTRVNTLTMNASNVANSLSYK